MTRPGCRPTLAYGSRAFLPLPPSEIGMSDHTFIPQPAPNRPGHEPYYRWKCSCGTESANFYDYKTQAEAAHAEHVQAQNAS